MSYRLIVGLGNPGSEFDSTRHNIGFRIIDAFAAKCGASEWTKQRNLKGDLSQLLLEDGCKLHLLKPMTFMNESGVSIQKVCSYYRVPSEETLIIHDDINLDVGVAKVSERGGSGGHNGLADIIARIKPTFTRLRVGIGQKTHKEMDLADYVLGKFSQEDQISINASMDYHLDCLERLIRDGTEKAMNQINRKTKNIEDGQL